MAGEVASPYDTFRHPLELRYASEYAPMFVHIAATIRDKKRNGREEIWPSRLTPARQGDEAVVFAAYASEHVATAVDLASRVAKGAWSACQRRSCFPDESTSKGRRRGVPCCCQGGREATVCRILVFSVTKHYIALAPRIAHLRSCAAAVAFPVSKSTSSRPTSSNMATDTM